MEVTQQALAYLHSLNMENLNSQNGIEDGAEVNPNSSPYPNRNRNPNPNPNPNPDPKQDVFNVILSSKSAVRMGSPQVSIGLWVQVRARVMVTSENESFGVIER